MKAIVRKIAGDPKVLRLIEVDKPEPKENQVMVKIYASSVTSGDVVLLRIPRIL